MGRERREGGMKIAVGAGTCKYMYACMHDLMISCSST